MVRKIRHFCWAGLLIWVAACMPSTSSPTVTNELVITEQVTSAPTITPDDPEMNIDIINNMTFFGPYYEKSVQLSNGMYSSTDSNDPYIVILQPQVVFEDLNGDGNQDAVVLLTENGGGTGWFVSIAVIVSQDGEFVQIGQFPIDDRPMIQSLEIVDGDIVLKATIHRATDVMVEPTQQVIQRYRVVENMLLKIALDSEISNGQMRTIILDQPVDGSEINSRFQVTGNMPIAPFENNLRLSLYSLDGTVLYQSGFMVSASDPGAPATFDNQIVIDGLPTGKWVQLELAELSMADGSIMTSNSVVVKIK